MGQARPTSKTYPAPNCREHSETAHANPWKRPPNHPTHRRLATRARPRTELGGRPVTTPSRRRRRARNRTASAQTSEPAGQAGEAVGSRPAAPEDVSGPGLSALEDVLRRGAIRRQRATTVDLPG